MRNLANSQELKKLQKNNKQIKTKINNNKVINIF